MKLRTRFRIPRFIFVLSSFLLVTACTINDEVVIKIPVLTTSEVTEISLTTATSGGVISSDGGSTITNRGVLISTSQTLPGTGWISADGSGAGSFTSNITGLTANTTYYIRAYATNSKGTGYGNTISFTTLEDIIIFNPNITYGSMTDIDGNTYKTVTIGTQTWMAENLKVTRYNDGTPIPNITDGSTWKQLTTGALCDFGNNSLKYGVYGKLYNWFAVSTGKLCPQGWHVPSDAEWTTLRYYLGIYAGGKLKETGTMHWANPNFGATNESGFTALPGGYRDNIGIYYYNGITGAWWSTTEDEDDDSISKVCYWSTFNDSSYFFKGSLNKVFGFSVRCVKD